MSRSVQVSITIALWGIVGFAFVGSLLFCAYRIVMMIVTFGMLCDSCNSNWDLLHALGLLPLGIMLVVGAMVLIVWHLDRWPYKMAAPAMLAVALFLAPPDVRHHWFWWFGI